MSDRTPIADFILQGNVLYGAEYTFLTYLPLKRQLVYAQVANGIPIGDNTGSITFNLDPDYEVISYEQTFAGVAEVQGSSRTVISQKRAVEALYLNNQISSNSTVRMVQLTYYRTLSLSDMDIYSPMWYIEIQIENDACGNQKGGRLDGQHHHDVQCFASVGRSANQGEDSHQQCLIDGGRETHRKRTMQWIEAGICFSTDTNKRKNLEMRFFLF